MTVQSNIAAVLLEQHAQMVTQTREIPMPGANELVVRNHAIAANPADWKIQDGAPWVRSFPTVLGSDVSGEVVSIDDQVTKFKKGDRICGFAGVFYSSKPDHGAWQTYTILREGSTAKITDSMSYTDASILPTAFTAALMALFVVLGIDKRPGAGIAKDSILLVWGAASSVGSATMQIARIQGFTVFGVASRSNHAWIQKLGAAQLFDYHDDDVVEQIVTAAKANGKQIMIAFDAVGEGSTLEQVPAVIKQSAGTGKVCVAIPSPEDFKAPDGVKIELLFAWKHAVDNAELGAWLFHEWLPENLSTGSIVPAPPIEIVPGGVEAAQAVLDRLRTGVSGKKLVVEVA